MKKLSIILPRKQRLELKLTRTRGRSVGEKPLLPPISEIKKVRSGNKMSRYFRHVFEHKYIKRLLGTNIAVLAFAGALLPTPGDTFTLGPEDLAEAVVLSSNRVTFATERTVQHPLEKIVISQGYSTFHPGLDYDGIVGDHVKPIMPGRVVAIQHAGAGVRGISSTAYGNAILVEHAPEVSSLYAHLSRIFVVENEQVETNTVIGEVGSTGRSTGDHLHLEVRKNGFPVNPYSILP